MKARVSRMAVSFAIVLVAYWGYALWVVPWIEPPAARPQGANAVSAEELQHAREAARHDPRRAMLSPLFGPDDWELGPRAKILESEQFRLLVEDWNTLDGNQVELRPCTMVFTPGGSGSPEERIRQSVVLQAPQGARLRFDRPLDLRRGNIGRLVGGVLVGTITVRSAGRLPQPEDDLWAITRDIQLTDDGLWTAHDVEFHYGPHFGRGAKLLIKFLPGERGTAEYHGLNIGGIESLELQHVERLYLGPQARSADRRQEPPGNDRMSLPPPGRPSEVKPAEDLASGGTLGPLEVTCRGPLRFDVARQLATFEDHVRLQRLNRSGPADELQCDLLAIHFARRRPPMAGSSPAEKSRGLLDLEPRRLEARGRPAVINAPSQDMDARAEVFQYDLLTRRLSLHPFTEDAAAPGGAVAVRQGGNEIHAPSIEYQLGEHGQWGQATAPGPGWVRVEVRDRPGQPVVARWQQELRLRPQEQEHVLSLLGGAELGYGGFGVLSALEIYFWMRQVPDQPGGRQMQPDRMLARQQVRLDSLQLSGAVDQLEVWFEKQPAGQGPQVAPGGRAGRDPRLETMRTAVDLSTRIPSALEEVWRPLNEAGQRLGLGSRSPSPSSTADGVPPAPIRPPPRPATHPERRFDVTGRLLRARVVTTENHADVAELMVEGKVHFLETRTTRPDDKPLVVKGDRVHLLDPAQPYAAATVVGSPAHFQARGLALSGSNINLNRGTNRLWTEGPGRLEIILDRDFSGQPIPGGLPVTIRWRERMALEGAILRFEEAVHVTSRLDQLHTDTLEISFKEPIPLGDPEKQSRPEVQKVRCRGGVVLESQSVDSQGPAAWQRLEATDMALDLVTGAATASGPGEVRSVRRGAAPLPLDRSEPPRAGAQAGAHAGAGSGSDPNSSSLEPPPEPPQDSSGLSYLGVRFQRGAAGNFRQRRLTFEGQVSAVFGPVAAWDERLSPDRPETLGPRGAVLRCDQLAVAQMPVPGTRNLSLELEALGNILVEGQHYTARAYRMTYAEAKDLLILEGDGRNDAQLFRQAYPGGPVSATAARRIQYWPSLRKGSVDGPRFLEHQTTAAPGP